MDAGIGSLRPEQVVPAPGADPEAPAAFELALSEATARKTIGVALGDRVSAVIDPGDPLLRNVFPRPVTAITIDVVALYTVRDPADARLVRRARPGRRRDGGHGRCCRIAAATALCSRREPNGDLVALALPMRYRWNLFVRRRPARPADARPARARTCAGSRPRSPRPGRLAPGTTPSGPACSASSTATVPNGRGPRRPWRSPRLDRWPSPPVRSACSASSSSAAGVGSWPWPVAAAHRSGQLLTAQLWEGLLITIPAALVGLVLADLLVGGPPNALSAGGAILVALAATALLLLATWPAARRARRDLERDDQPVFRLSTRRLVFEALIVGLSLAAVWFLRERGLTTSQSAGGRASFDPFLAAAPLLARPRGRADPDPPVSDPGSRPRGGSRRGGATWSPSSGCAPSAATPPPATSPC